MPSEPRETRRKLEQLRTALRNERSSFDSHWRELSEFLMPRRSRFLSSDRNKGDKRNQNIIDSTARFAARTLQSGLHAGLTSPARPWFNLTTPNPELRKRDDVRAWLEDVTQRMRMVFTGSNLYNVLPIIYGDMGCFGTSAMGVLQDTKDLFRCVAYPVGSYCLGVDGRGIVTTFSRDYELSVRAVVETFGVKRGYKDIDWAKVSPTVKRLWDDGTYEAAVPLCWITLPNVDADPGRLESKFKRFSSYHWEIGSQDPVFLEEKGFDSFPVLAPRWDITGEDSYGTDCPGMVSLGDVKQLQAMQRELGKALKKLVDPPMVGAPELRTQKVSILPGDITYVREPQHGLRAAHEMNIDLNHVRQGINEVQYRIQRAWYEDLFLMMAAADARLGAARPTAREIDERHEEKLLALGPVLERTNDELLDPLIDRVFGMMVENGLVPPAPEVLQGSPVRVEYVSIMAQAQKLVGVASQDRFLASIMPLGQVFPQVLDKIDPFVITENYADQLGVDPRSLRSDEDAQAIGDARAKQQQAIEQAKQAQQIGSAVKSVGSTPADQDSVLTRLAQNLSGAVPTMGPQVGTV